MKKLINPPIQALLLLSSAGILGLGAWSLVSLKLQDETQAHSNEVSVHIPDAKILDTPDMNAYPQMVNAPLFWASRKPFEAPAAVIETVAAPADTALPEGRLIGIVDLGDHLFGVMQTNEGKGQHLKVGDSWGAWKVTGIDPDKLIVEQAGQKQDIPLVADFASPQVNPQLAKTKQQAQQAAVKKPPQQVAQAAAAANALVPPPAESANNAAAGTPANAGLPFPADTEKQPPALSVKEALEARQRLMASRWGSLSGDAEAPAPTTPQAGQ